MAFEITSPTDEYTLRAYTDARNKVRDIITYGVYPHAKQAVEAYDALDIIVTSLASGSTNQQALATYHSSLMSVIADDTADLRTYAESLIASIEAIETLQPGTFGIELPEEE